MGCVTEWDAEMQWREVRTISQLARVFPFFPDRYSLHSGISTLPTPSILAGHLDLVNATTMRSKSRRAIRLPTTRAVIGVDFSGAAQSGKTAWLAEMHPNEQDADGPRWVVSSLSPLGRLARSDDRAAVCQYLVDRILSQNQTLWGCDFPFGLPIELGLGGWTDQLSHVERFSDGAKEYGRHLVKLSQELGMAMHVRRQTDRETQTPFDCYHYRIIYQTFHGMRDVLFPLVDHLEVAVLPFQYDRLRGKRGADRLVVEACPSSTLKRLRLPHQRYKQSGGKPPEALHRKTRRVILKELSKIVEISDHRRRVIMNDSGGDALDAVLAGLGGWLDWERVNHRAIASHSRYPIEGRVYA